MTDSEVLEHYEEMKKIFGDKMPDMDHCPATFAFMVKIYKHYYMNKPKDEKTN